MKRNILLLLALCVLFSSISVLAQSTSNPMAQHFAAQDKDKDKDKDHDKYKHKKKHKHHKGDKDKDDKHDHDHDKH